MNLVTQSRTRILDRKDSPEGHRPAAKRVLGFVPHQPQPFARAGQQFRGRAGDGASLQLRKQRLQTCRAAEAGIHSGEFSGGLVGHRAQGRSGFRFALQPRLLPGREGFGKPAAMIVQMPETQPKRSPPRGLRMRGEKAGERRHVLAIRAPGIARERRGEHGVFRGGGFARRHERLGENLRAGNFASRRTGGKRQRRRRWHNHGDSAVDRDGWRSWDGARDGWNCRRHRLGGHGEQHGWREDLQPNKQPRGTPHFPRQRCHFHNVVEKEAAVTKA